MEVSSHGLDQGRVNGVAFDCALFTNLTHDHLDYHGTLTAYAEAKARLFDAPGLGGRRAQSGRPVRRAARAAPRGARRAHDRLFACPARRLPNSFPLRSLEGQKAEIHSSWGSAAVTIPQLGRFNVANALGVLGCLVAKGIPFGEGATLLATLPPVAGRMQQIGGCRAAAGGGRLRAHARCAGQGAVGAAGRSRRRAAGAWSRCSAPAASATAAKRPVMGSVAARARRPRRAHLRQSARRGSAGDHRRRSASGVSRRLHRRARPRQGHRRRDRVGRRRRRRADRRQGPRETTRRSPAARLPFSDAGGGRRGARPPEGRDDEPRRSRRAPCRRARSGADVRFDGVSTDTRIDRQGRTVRRDPRRALRRPRFPRRGEGARRRGGAGATSSAQSPGERAAAAAGRRRHAARARAPGRHWRLRFAPALIAVTGSNGKTTIKEMLASILRAHAGEGGALATRGNLNTDIGVPLTLLGLRASHRYCAIELGMNHPGEIALLADIARPTIALVNNAQREHLEFMQSVEAVAAENASVFDALPADGVAVLNADDAMAGVFRRKAGRAPARRVRPAARRGHRPLRAQGRCRAKSCCRRPSGEARGDAGDPRPAQRAQCARRRGLRARRRHSADGDRRGPVRVPALRRPAAGEEDRRRRDADRRQLQRQPGFGARRDRRARVLPGPDRAGARRHGRSRRRRAPRSTPRSGRYAKEKGIDALLALGAATPDAVEGVRRGRAAFRRRRRACSQSRIEAQARSSSRARASCAWSAWSPR